MSGEVDVYSYYNSSRTDIDSVVRAELVGSLI